MTEYQNRADIDKIFKEFYDYVNNTRPVQFKSESIYSSISSQVSDERTDEGTIDALMTYYKLDTVADTVDELSNDIDELNIFKSSIFDIIYPIGTLYHTKDTEFDPNDSFEGQWNKISEDNNIYIWERVIETE